MKKPVLILSLSFLVLVISVSLVIAAEEQIAQISLPVENIGEIVPLAPVLPEPIPCTVDDCWLFNNQEHVLSGIDTMQSTLETCNQQRLDALETLQAMYEAAVDEINKLSTTEFPVWDPTCPIPTTEQTMELGEHSAEPNEPYPYGSDSVYKTDFNNLIDDLKRFCSKPAKVLNGFSDKIKSIQKFVECFGGNVTNESKEYWKEYLKAKRAEAQAKLESSQWSYNGLTLGLNNFETYFPIAANNSADICGPVSLVPISEVEIPSGLPPPLQAQLSASYWAGNLVVKDITATGDKLIAACPAGTDRTKLASAVFFDQEGKALYSYGYSEGGLTSLSVFNYQTDDPATEQDESSVIESVQQYTVKGDLARADINGDGVDVVKYVVTDRIPSDYFDVGGDGIVDSRDVSAMQSLIDARTGTNLNESLRVDINSDGVIDQKDVEFLESVLKSFVDINGDGVIDVCSDSDNDAIIDGIDNCPSVPNPDQSDLDTDGLGDVCDNCPCDPDNDADNDGICGDVDSCPLENPQGLDANADGCTDTLEGLYDNLQSREIHAGVKNSLLAKVSNTLSSLTNGRTNAAINQLNAFINQVKAQSGKKISWEDTAVLASFAQNIGWVIAMPADPTPPGPPGGEKGPVCSPPSSWDKDNPPILTDLYLCQSTCRTNYMNTPNNPAYHRTQTFLDCMDDCYRRFGPSCDSDNPDATPTR